MDWIGEALSVVFGVTTLWQRAKTRKAQAAAMQAQLEAQEARAREAEALAEQQRTEAELKLIRRAAGTMGPREI